MRPKVVRSVHYCPATKKTLERRYTDMTSYDPFPSSSIYPTKDEDGKCIFLLFVLIFLYFLSEIMQVLTKCIYTHPQMYDSINKVLKCFIVEEDGPPFVPLVDKP